MKISHSENFIGFDCDSFSLEQVQAALTEIARTRYITEKEADCLRKKSEEKYPELRERYRESDIRDNTL